MTSSLNSRDIIMDQTSASQDGEKRSRPSTEIQIQPGQDINSQDNKDLEKQIGLGNESYDEGEEEVDPLPTNENNDTNGENNTTGEGLSGVLSRAFSRTSVRSAAGPPPDGGLEAWTAGMSHTLSP